MSIQKNDRVIIKDLAWEIAQSQADSHSERWQEADGDDSMRRTIVSAMNQHGWSPDGVPGVLPHIYRMLEAGEISAQSTFNGMPPANVSEIEVNPANWYVTRQDADKVKALLLATARQPIDEQTVAQDEYVAAYAEFVHNGKPIDWQYWLMRQQITPEQAAKLVYCIDPIIWPSDRHDQGQIDDELRIKIQRCAEWLTERSQAWTLSALVDALGKDSVPYGMAEAVWEALAKEAKAQQDEVAQVTDQRNEEDASLSPVKKGVLLRELQQHYPGLANALQANEPEFRACRVPDASAPGNKRGYYYREKVVAVCEGRWGRSTTQTRPSSVELNSLGAQVRGMRDGKKFS